MHGKTILITAGPTYEKIDPVRFIGNYSSGKMGYALAAEAARRGAKVVLVSGPVALPTPEGDIERIDVESAAEMYEATTSRFPEADAAILCAAVADFTPDHTATTKIKRGDDGMVLHLVPTRDIAAALGGMTRDGQTLVGFALETDNELSNALGKMERKHLDMIVLNSLQDPGAGFRTDTNKVTIITHRSQTALALQSKASCACHIVDALASLIHNS